MFNVLQVIRRDQQMKVDRCALGGNGEPHLYVGEQEFDAREPALALFFGTALIEFQAIVVRHPERSRQSRSRGRSGSVYAQPRGIPALKDEIFG
jgi:hypothetical protein